MSKNGRFVISNIENAIIPAAIPWYISCTLAGRFNISSKADPMMSTNRERRMGIEKLSNLKNITIANNTGIVTAKPPNEGVMPS